MMLDIVKKNREEIIIVLIFIFFALGFNMYRVQGDGFIYYRFLEHFLNLSRPETPPFTISDGEIFRQGGCAYLNAPFYLAAYMIEGLFKTKPDFNGITFRQISINLASNFYIALALILTIKILKKMNFKHTLLPNLSILFSTSAFAAAVVVPSWSHAVDIFITALFFYGLLVNETKHAIRPFWLGSLVVIATLVRYLNIIFAIFALMFYLTFKKYKMFKEFLFGFLAIAWFIPLIFYTYNNAILPLHESAALPGNINYSTPIIMKTFLDILMFKNVLKLLVHPLHGLLVWSPVVILSILGLLYFPKGKEKLGYFFLAFLFVYISMHGFIYRWYAGWSFSNRYLVSMFPIYVIGLAAFLEKYEKKTTILVVLLTAYSIILYINWHLNIMNGEFGTPLDMVQAWIRGESSTFVDGEVNLKTALLRLWEFCRYKYLFRIF